MAHGICRFVSSTWTPNLAPSCAVNASIGIPPGGPGVSGVSGVPEDEDFDPPHADRARRRAREARWATSDLRMTNAVNLQSSIVHQESSTMLLRMLSRRRILPLGLLLFFPASPIPPAQDTAWLEPYREPV